MLPFHSSLYLEGYVDGVGHNSSDRPVTISQGLVHDVEVGVLELPVSLAVKVADQHLVADEGFPGRKYLVHQLVVALAGDIGKGFTHGTTQELPSRTDHCLIMWIRHPIDMGRTLADGDESGRLQKDLL
jgi:hypothetical protein